MGKKNDVRRFGWWIEFEDGRVSHYIDMKLCFPQLPQRLPKTNHRSFPKERLGPIRLEVDLDVYYTFIDGAPSTDHGDSLEVGIAHLAGFGLHIATVVICQRDMKR